MPIITKNKVKKISKEELTTQVNDLHKLAIIEHKAGREMVIYKKLYDLCEFHKIDIKAYVKNVKLSKLNINRADDVQRVRFDTGAGKSRRQTVYECFISNKCTIRNILDVINTDSQGIFNKITKDNYRHIMNMIVEKKGRKDVKGVERAINMRINAKGVLIECKASERLNKAIKYSDYIATLTK